MYNFEHALGEVNFNKNNTEPTVNGHQAVGWSNKGWCGNSVYMRGGSRNILLPIVKLIELIDPSFSLRFDVPEQTTSYYDSISDNDLNRMAEAPPSVFWIDREWAKNELDQRIAGQQWRNMQTRIERSRVEAKQEAQTQSLRERLKIALFSNRIVAIDPEAPYGAKVAKPTASGRPRGR